MIRLRKENINTAEFWDIQYAPQRREDYISKVCSISATHKYDKLLEYVKDKDRVLDLACGFGLGAIFVKDTYPKCEVWGVDQSNVIIKDLIVTRPDINFRVFRIGDGTLPTDYFDVVFAGDVIEHLDDPRNLFEEAKRVLKKGGFFAITTPDGEVKPYAASPEHVWLFTHEDMDNLYMDNGFEAPEYPYIAGKEGVIMMFSVGVKK